MKTLAQISCIAVTCLILLLMISSAQAQWYTEPLYAHVQPRLLDGRNVYFDDDAQTFSGLYDQPGLWFFTCDDDGCTTEPVDQRLYEFGRAYLFKRASVFEAVYDDETTGQIWHAGEAFDHWNVQPLDLPIPGKKLMSLTVRADTGLVYLIYKIGERKYLLAWEEWTNKDKVWRTEALDWYYGDTYPFAVTSDGAVHVISRDRSGGNVIRYWRRDPAGHWRREIEIGRAHV